MSWLGLGRRRPAWRLLVVPVVAVASGVGAVPATAANETVQAWLTTTSGGKLVSALASQPPLTFGTSSATRPVVTVDAATTYQTIDGFGGALTDSAAWLISTSPQRGQIMQDLFGAGGASYSVVRLPIGASDLSLSAYTYDDQCCSLSGFSVGHDAAYIIPVLRQARQLNPALKAMALPWSAPRWMKFGGTLGGDCSGAGNYLINSYYATYAGYFTEFVSAYANGYGIPIYAVSMQNEPHNCDSSYPTMSMEPADQSNFALALHSALAGAGLGAVKIIAWDHNWYEGGSPTTYPQQVLSYANGQALGAVSGAAYHCYSSPTGAYSVQTTFHDAYPTKDVYFTECTSGSWATNVASNLVWELQNNLIGPLRNWARTSLYWSLALDPNAGPAIGGCTGCRGMLTIDNASGTYTRNGEYYAWAHLSKVVAPGAVRIASPDLGSGNIQTVAFKNPDGSIALIALNSGTAAINFRVSWAGQSFDYTLPASAVVSFRWRPGVSTSYAIVGRRSGACVDAAGWGTTDGTVVQQWTCGGGANQAWRLLPTSAGYDAVLNVNAAAADLVWDVKGGTGATADGAKIQLWAYGGATNQQWRPVPLGGGLYELVARNSGKCLDVPGGSTSSGTQLQQWTCTGAANQAFALVAQP
jgi:glucosylceramidase